LNSGPIAVGPSVADNGRMDINTLAYKIVQQSIGELPLKKIQPATAQRGLKRAAALTPERRKEIAKKASAKRWTPKVQGSQRAGDGE
jgi:hypothetical protein